MRKTDHFISLLITPDHCKVTVSERTIKNKNKIYTYKKDREREKL